MESDRRPKLLFGGIFFDEPVSTSSENALVFRLKHLLPIDAWQTTLQQLGAKR